MNETIIDQDFVANQDRFRRSTGLAKFLRVLYLLVISASLIDSMIQLWAYFVVEKGIMLLHESDYVRLETAGIFQTIINVLNLLMSTAASVLFLVWINRSYQNLPALGEKTAFGKWLFGLSWFIPIVGFILPIIGIREIWNAYQKQNGENPRLWQGLEFVYLWWGLYVLYRLFWLASALPSVYILVVGEPLFPSLDLNNAILLGIGVQTFVFIPLLILQMYLVRNVNQWELIIHQNRDEQSSLTAIKD